MFRSGVLPAVSPAPYASRPEESRGRLVPERLSPPRTEFQRDRDRIVHSTAFRRLLHKTQVFVHHVGDHYRTRLTHTLEVAQIARSAARTLGLNEDLAEAVALAHDLGHAPFGHSGEDALNHAAAEHGGFDHNVQTLRIVTRLERRYASFDGLNLTWEALEGIVKHNGPLTGPHGSGRPLHGAVAEYVAMNDLEIGGFAGPEAQIAAVADDVAHISHDIDDSVRAGLFAPADLDDVPLAGPTLAEVRRLHPGIETPRLLHETTRRLIDRMVTDLVEETRRRAEDMAPSSAAEVRGLDAPLAAFAPAMAEDLRLLRRFLIDNMYRHPKVAEPADRGARVVAELYGRYAETPSEIPKSWRGRGSVGGPSQNAGGRHVVDFIAGMTDRYAIAEHRRLTGVGAQPLL